VGLVVAAAASCGPTGLLGPPLPAELFVQARKDDTVLELLALDNSDPEPIELCLRDVVIMSEEGHVHDCAFPALRACLVMPARSRVLDVPFRSGSPCPDLRPGPARVLVDVFYRHKRAGEDDPWKIATVLTAARVDVVP
jgi:hypothetical protein